MSALAESAAMRALHDTLMGGDGPLFHFPIRHHSPACALHLARAFDVVKPRTLVLEMPVDFAPLLPLVLDPATRPPIAIVAVVASEHPGDAPAATTYWPLSASSPELTALRHAQATGMRVVLADRSAGFRLPTRETRKPNAGDDDKPETVKSPPSPLILTDEQPVAASDYIQALVRRLGVRDYNEAWDRLFESRAAEVDWRLFFADIGVHCALARRTMPPDDLRDSGTIARESFMRQVLREVVRAAECGPIAVVTGGLHTPALLDLSGSDEPATAPDHQATPYLVRFGHKQLDRMNGYAAGMPSPRYYERLQTAVAEGKRDPFFNPSTDPCSDPFMAVAEDVFLALAARLRAEQPGLVPPFPALVEALRQAQGLASLRDLAGPGRSEILDAARSCFLKDDDPRFSSPLFDVLERVLVGEDIGHVPVSAGAPPLVEAARNRARTLGFKVDDGLERKRDLDIHRKPRHRAASRFLHAMTLLGTRFARKIQGPDFQRGLKTGALFESWTCAWSPLVEGRLVALAGDGATIEHACAAELARRAEALEAQGAGRDSSAAVALVMTAAQAGVTAAASDLLQRLGRVIARDPEFARVVDCLAALDILWRGRAVLGLSGSALLKPLVSACYRRAIDLLPDIATSQDEAASANARALAGLHHLLETAEASGTKTAIVFDRDLLDEGIAALMNVETPPLIAGVLAALAYLAGQIDEPALARVICGALGGAVVPQDRCAPLAGLLLVQPVLLRRCDGLLAGMDAVFEAMAETDFLEILPDLRLALTALDPHETDALADRIAGMKGLAEPLLPPGTVGVTIEEAIENARRSQALAQLLIHDGLGGDSLGGESLGGEGLGGWMGP